MWVSWVPLGQSLISLNLILTLVRLSKLLSLETVTVSGSVCDSVTLGECELQCKKKELQLLNYKKSQYSTQENKKRLPISSCIYFNAIPYSSCKGMHICGKWPCPEPQNIAQNKNEWFYLLTQPEHMHPSRHHFTNDWFLFKAVAIAVLFKSLFIISIIQCVHTLVAGSGGEDVSLCCCTVFYSPITRIKQNKWNINQVCHIVTIDS